MDHIADESSLAAKQRLESAWIFERWHGTTGRDPRADDAPPGAVGKAEGVASLNGHLTQQPFILDPAVA